MVNIWRPPPSLTPQPAVLKVFEQLSGLYSRVLRPFDHCVPLTTMVASERAYNHLPEKETVWELFEAPASPHNSLEIASFI